MRLVPSAVERAPVPIHRPTVFKLHVYSQSGDLDQQVEVEGDTVIIGRSSDCHVVIDRKDISRRHARLLCGFVVDDLSSRNGTHVDGAKIEHATLVPSRSFEVGDATSQNLVTIEVVGSDDQGSRPDETSNPEVMEPASDAALKAVLKAPDLPAGLAETKSRAMLEAEAARYRYKCAKLELELVHLRKKLDSLGHGEPQGSATVEFKADFLREKKRVEPPKSEGAAD